MHALATCRAMPAGGDADVTYPLFVEIVWLGLYTVNNNIVNGGVNGVELSRALD